MSAQEASGPLGEILREVLLTQMELLACAEVLLGPGMHRHRLRVLRESRAATMKMLSQLGSTERPTSASTCASGASGSIAEMTDEELRPYYNEFVLRRTG